MFKSSRTLRTIILMFWAGILSALTGVLGAAPLRVVYQSAGFLTYLAMSLGLLGLTLMTGLYSFTAALLIQILLIGIYSELETRDYTLRQSGGLAVLLTASAIFSGFYLWTTLAGKAAYAIYSKAIDAVLVKIATYNIAALSDLKAEDVIAQTPSAIIIFLIISLGLALIFEKQIARWAGVKVQRAERLTNFSLPDFIIWAFIFSLLGAFAKHGSSAAQIISINVLNVSVVLFFFQGLAVLGRYFETFRVGMFWRFIWIMILVIQLPMLMAILGLVDYWVDFRRMFNKKATELKKKSIRE